MYVDKCGHKSYMNWGFFSSPVWYITMIEYTGYMVTLFYTHNMLILLILYTIFFYQKNKWFSFEIVYDALGKEYFWILQTSSVLLLHFTNLNRLQVTSNNWLHFSLGCICTIDFNLLQSVLLLSLLERILRPQNQEYMLAVSSHSRLSKLSLLPWKRVRKSG